mmetsp:Transcript_153088/g.270095  ORF Transcript_153088/g.270095 Transcript_153088/m.270095 type:complete len:256 (-) Transcript_153088:4284-5051(-)
MKPEHLRHLRWETVFNELHISYVVQLGSIRRLKAGRKIHTVQQLRGHIHHKICVVHTSVPEVCYVSTIHDVAKDVPQIWPWHLRAQFLRIVQVVVKNLPTDGQITIVERILPGPALSSELNAPGDKRMEPAESQQRCLESFRNQAAVNVLLRELRICSAQVRLQVSRCFIRHLDASLQDGFWEKRKQPALHSAGRLGSEDASEVWQRELLDDLQVSLEQREPLLHKMDILKHDPAALLCELAQTMECDILLPLAH